MSLAGLIEIHVLTVPDLPDLCAMLIAEANSNQAKDLPLFIASMWVWLNCKQEQLVIQSMLRQSPINGINLSASFPFTLSPMADCEREGGVATSIWE